MGEMRGSRKSTNDNSEKVLLSDVQSTVDQYLQHKDRSR